MYTDDRPESEVSDRGDFASLTKVSLRRSADGRDKKSDITDALKSMRPTPEFVHRKTHVDRENLRDVTPVGPADIVAYWDCLRASRPMPPRDLLQVSDVAARWPNSILFRCGPSDNLSPDSAFAMALRAHREGNAAPLFEGGAEISALLSQWILTVARNTVAKSSPCLEASAFDTSGGQLHCKIAAVPFGTGLVDHVLCNVESAAPAT